MLNPHNFGSYPTHEQYQSLISKLEGHIKFLQQHIQHLETKLQETKTLPSVEMMIRGTPSQPQRYWPTQPLSQQFTVVESPSSNVFPRAPMAPTNVPAMPLAIANSSNVKAEQNKTNQEVIQQRYCNYARQNDLAQLIALENEHGKISKDTIGDKTRLKALDLALTEADQLVVKHILTNMHFASSSDAIEMIVKKGDTDCILSLIEAFKVFNLKDKIAAALYKHKRIIELKSILADVPLCKAFEIAQGFDSTFINAAKDADIPTLKMLKNHVSKFLIQQAYANAKAANNVAVLTYLSAGSDNGLDIDSIMYSVAHETRGKSILLQLSSLWYPTHLSKVLKELKALGENAFLNELIQHLKIPAEQVKEALGKGSKKRKNKVKENTSGEPATANSGTLTYSYTKHKSKESVTVTITASDKPNDVQKSEEKHKDYSRVHNLLS